MMFKVGDKVVLVDDMDRVHGALRALVSYMYAGNEFVVSSVDINSITITKDGHNMGTWTASRFSLKEDSPPVDTFFK